MVAESESGVRVHLDELLESRALTLTELATQVDVTVVNLSVLKNGRVKAIRFSTLAALCEALACQPGELLSWGGTATAGRPNGGSRRRRL